MEIYWHGTSTANLTSIQEGGLKARPAKRIYAGHRGASWDRPSEKSCDGVYLAKDVVEAFDFARNAVRGNEAALLVAVQADEKDALPDEDRLPTSRLLREVLYDLNISEDTDGHAIFRRKWGRRDFREKVIDVAIEIGHRWLFQSPAELPPDRQLIGEILISQVDRMLAHLSDNEAVMDMVGQQRKKLPFPVPNSWKDVVDQEERHLRMLDEVARRYQHLALAQTYPGSSKLEQKLRLPFDVGHATEAPAHIVAAVEVSGNVARMAFGDLPPEIDLSRLVSRRGVALEIEDLEVLASFHP
jgi:hypothetical protein